MEKKFPTSTPWNLSELGDITDWVPQLLRLPGSRELAGLMFEIREVGKSISRVDFLSEADLDAPGEEEEEDDDEDANAPVVTPAKQPPSSSRPIRSARLKKTTEDVATVDLNLSPELPAQPTSSAIRVKRATRGKGVSEGTDSVETTFPTKVRL